jgi:asparagine synthase (glutamine-hydrolysing)
MCGIAGVLARDPRRDVGPLIDRLTHALAHRGPDGSGTEFLGGRAAALGHRRLSILDLECGAQPMASADGRVWIVYNGELYNHLELRRELAARGRTFRTRSDTETIVHGWEEWGPAVLERMNGMYALALFDGRSPTPASRGEIWLARDPVGIKPLYLGIADGVWWFASELAAARAVGLVEPDLRPEALAEYLVYRFVPSPGTPYRAAWKVPPGHSCRLALDALPEAPRFEPFTTAFQPASLPRQRGEWEEALVSGLARAVQRQLMSDVPLGVLLSGGVDSTLIAGFMRDGLPDPPQAFAIGFRSAPDGGELPVARRAAAALGVPLTEVGVADADYLAAWPEQAAALGEPIANSGVLLLGLLCRTVRGSRKVALTGQGADEPLGGYPRHAAERFYPLARRLRPLLDRIPESLAAADRVARLRRVAGASDEARRFAEILAVFSPREAVALAGQRLDADALVEPVRRWLPAAGEGSDSLNRLLWVDARLSLADDLLIVADHTAMASSVELRVPFLDLEFLALVERMPGRYKVSRWAERKWLYRKAVERRLPPAVRRSLVGWRARTGAKLGFTTPFETWFRRWLATDAEAFFLGPSARLPHVLAAGPVRELLGSARDRGAPRHRQVLALYVLEAWLRRALA